MNDSFSPARSDAIRDGLIERVESSARTRPGRTSPGWISAASLLVVGLVVGGTASAVAVTSVYSSQGKDTDTAAAVPAPPGVIPGQPIISLLGTPTSIPSSGSATITLPAIPSGATHVRVTVTCLSPGKTSFGFDQGGNNPSLQCSAADLESQTNVAWQDLALPSSTNFYLSAADDVDTLIGFQYLNHVPTAWGVNARGETFGTVGDGVDPDLIAAVGVDASGNPVEGYARSADLDAFGPDWPDMPANPEEALEWQRERDAKYPDGWDIPIYASDGVTSLGTMHIEG